jgi:hypothetical protein
MGSPCCQYMFPPPPNVATQQLGNHVPTGTNTYETVEELLDAMFFMPSMSYQILIMY